MNAADVIARRLHAAGCRFAFGIPGGEVLTLIDALERAGIRFVLTRHENAAGFMAEGGWHATGAPGILVATVGPGVANAFNVVANAEQDRVPLIVISGAVDAAEAMRYTHQVFDHSAAFAQICKASFVAPDGAIDAMIDKALAIALAGRPGPVHIDLPIRVADTGQPDPPVVLRGPALLSAPAPSPALDRARAMFAAARRPVMMAGLDPLNEPGGAQAVRVFVEKHGIPLVTSYKAKGILPEDHPLALGGHGLSPKSDRIVLPVFDSADLVIAAGYDPIEMRAGWRDPWDPAKAIEFAHAPNRHDMHYAGLSWVCSVAGGLAALDGEAKGGWPDDLPACIRAELADAFAPKGDWGPGQAIAEILAAAPPEVTITIDSGAHRILLSQQWRAMHPRGVLQSTGLCTMGCALPLGMGFKYARPEAPVIAFMGDAGLEMTLGELATLRDLGLPLVVVVFVDRSLALIEMKQRGAAMANAGVDFQRTDFAALARVYGGFGVTVTGPGETGPAVVEALAAERFTIIAVEIPRRAYDGLF
ncbi:MAG: thiamine pyrophosphate-binding protein [Proteobacteria bacterium]|nr:thiamine pyrophosphate-binding protein [Pseudomonadota bacterium]